MIVCSAYLNPHTAIGSSNLEYKYVTYSMTSYVITVKHYKMFAKFDSSAGHYIYIYNVALTHIYIYIYTCIYYINIYYTIKLIMLNILDNVDKLD